MNARSLVAAILALALLAGCTVPAPSTPTAQPPTATPGTPPPGLVEVSVYFTDSGKYATGTPPFEVAVTRPAAAGADLPRAVLDEFFKGPSAEESARGLEAITSGFTGYSSLEVQGGIARVHLTGPCTSNGATYTIAQLLIRNLTQFDEIKCVKIYDADGGTMQPEGESHSIPGCLEP